MSDNVLFAIILLVVFQCSYSYLLKNHGRIVINPNQLNGLGMLSTSDIHYINNKLTIPIGPRDSFNVFCKSLTNDFLKLLGIFLTYLFSITWIPLKAIASEAITTTTKAVKRKRNIGEILLLVLRGSAKGIQTSAGDSGSGLKALLNTAGQLFMLGALFMGAFFVQKQQEFAQIKGYNNELEKLIEYKENMYFEAVEEILNKLNGGKLKGSIKANLNRQLKDLDPDGSIQEFITDRGARPDLTDRLDFNKKPKTKGGKKKTRNMKKKKKNSGSNSSSIQESENSKKKTPVNYYGDNDEGNFRSNDNSRGSSSSGNDSSSSSRSSSSSEDGDRLWRELYASLAHNLSSESRKKLVTYLKNRMDTLSSEQKRETAMVKIAQRLGDVDYWMNYAQKLGLE